MTAGDLRGRPGSSAHTTELGFNDAGHPHAPIPIAVFELFGGEVASPGVDDAADGCGTGEKGGGEEERRGEKAGGGDAWRLCGALAAAVTRIGDETAEEGLEAYISDSRPRLDFCGNLVEEEGSGGSGEEAREELSEDRAEETADAKDKDGCGETEEEEEEKETCCCSTTSCSIMTSAAAAEEEEEDVFVPLFGFWTCFAGAEETDNF